ncbi:transposase family protein [Lipingzhangella sp. LS1_29]|uniref:Transposase family protein n=1 Tax=Lipingzhangella rawalii TaxID=2055835 RepID=A0ABU2H919_9ACTN|nr:transposase family protein [Lipingzhangella rawalii]MDS1271797.1 transposase family protein [Lipingzhangella rawalii]
MYFKTNVSVELIAELLFVDQATISRAICELKEPIADVLHEFVPDPADEVDGRVGVVDGPLCPSWSWSDAPELYSGNHKTTGHNHQFACDLSGELLHVSYPSPGSTHDAKAFGESVLNTILNSSNSIGDKGYIDVDPITPFRKPQGGELLD